MCTRSNIDEGLNKKNTNLVGVTSASNSVKVSDKALIERKSAKHLARLGSSEPQAKKPFRRQSVPK